MEGISKEDLMTIIKYGIDTCRPLTDIEVLEVLLVHWCKELNPWMPIETAPENREFLALSCERDHIELLINDGVDLNFFNLNSGNYTDKIYWSHWMEKPRYPKT